VKFESIPRGHDNGHALEERARAGGLPFPQARDMRGFAAFRLEFREAWQKRAAALGEFRVEGTGERLLLFAERAAQTGKFRAADFAGPMVLQDRENHAKDKEKADQPPFDKRLLRAGVHDWPAFTARRIIAGLARQGQRNRSSLNIP